MLNAIPKLKYLLELGQLIMQHGWPTFHVKLNNVCWQLCLLIQCLQTSHVVQVIFIATLLAKALDQSQLDVYDCWPTKIGQALF